MKTLLFLFIIVVSITSSCRFVHEKIDAPFQPTLPYKPAGIDQNTIHSGYKVYTQNCYQCHQQADPTTISTKNWAMTVPVMAKHAGISEEKGKQVLDYILSVKSEGVR